MGDGSSGLLTVLHLLSEVKNYPEVDETLLREVTNTYRHVERWDLPEESGLSGSLPEAIECTLPELIRSLGHAGNQLARVRDMLSGVNVRLNLVGSYAAMDEALHLVNEELYSLDRACEAIADETGLASSFPLRCSRRPSLLGFLSGRTFVPGRHHRAREPGPAERHGQLHLI